MTDLEAAACLKELQDYNLRGLLKTPQNEDMDSFWDCAFNHAIRALEERADCEGRVTYRKNPNGSYTAQL